MTENYEAIRRVFIPDDLRPELAANGVDGTVLVQTWASLEETKCFLETAAINDFISGVVGWVDLTDPKIDETLSILKARSDGRFLVGIRHLVHDEPDPNWLLRDEVRRGLTAVGRAGLAYDLLLRIREIPAGLRTVEEFPDMHFVIDHIAKPNIRDGAFRPWAALMRQFEPHRDHVWCKLSGMVTEANWKAWKPQDLEPYVHEVLDIFSPDNCMFGSDWPVCLVASTYGRVKNALESCLDGLSKEERMSVLGGAAIRAYRLPDYFAAGDARAGG
jgi:L-fuconolactonase